MNLNNEYVDEDVDDFHSILMSNYGTKKINTYQT